MSKNFSVVLRVPVLGVRADELEDFTSDPLGFLQEFDLFDEAVVEAINETN